jgi:hypothetical protein
LKQLLAHHPIDAGPWHGHGPGYLQSHRRSPRRSPRPDQPTGTRLSVLLQFAGRVSGSTLWLRATHGDRIAPIWTQSEIAPASDSLWKSGINSAGNP